MDGARTIGGGRAGGRASLTRTASRLSLRPRPPAEDRDVAVAAADEEPAARLRERKDCTIAGLAPCGRVHWRAHKQADNARERRASTHSDERTQFSDYHNAFMIDEMPRTRPAPPDVVLLRDRRLVSARGGNRGGLACVRPVCRGVHAVLTVKVVRGALNKKP